MHPYLLHLRLIYLLLLLHTIVDEPAQTARPLINNPPDSVPQQHIQTLLPLVFPQIHPQLVNHPIFIHRLVVLRQVVEVGRLSPARPLTVNRLIERVDKREVVVLLQLVPRVSELLVLLLEGLLEQGRILVVQRRVRVGQLQVVRV
jgi:hypothetical protein